MTGYYSYFKTLNALFDILNVGKAIIQEVSSCYNFVVDIVIAETLRRRSMYVTSACIQRAGNRKANYGRRAACDT